MWMTGGLIGVAIVAIRRPKKHRAPEPPDVIGVEFD
jgi:hypothetical protein